MQKRRKKGLWGVLPNNGWEYFATRKTEKNRWGPPEVQITPPVALIPKGRFFSPDDSEALTCNSQLLINRMKPFLPSRPVDHTKGLAIMNNCG